MSSLTPYRLLVPVFWGMAFPGTRVLPVLPLSTSVSLRPFSAGEDLVAKYRKKTSPLNWIVKVDQLTKEEPEQIK